MKSPEMLVMDCALRYHPIAFRQAVADVLSEIPKARQSDAVHFHGVLDIARKEPGGASPVELGEDEWQTKLASITIDFSSKEGAAILDAHLLPIGVPSALEADQFSGEWHVDGPVFIYFGENAFPSPYPGSGINGAYVEIRPSELDSRPAVKFRFTLSPEIAAWQEVGEINSNNRAKDLLLAGRVYTFMASADEDGGPVNWSDPYPIAIGDDATVAAMLPEIQAPMLHAWRALRAWHHGELNFTLACDEDLNRADRRKADRAQSIEDLRRFNAEASGRGIEPLVAVLHGPGQKAQLLPYHYDVEETYNQKINEWQGTSPKMEIPALLSWADYFACRASQSSDGVKVFFGEQMLQLLDHHADCPMTDEQSEFFNLNVALGHAYKLSGSIEGDDWIGVETEMDTDPLLNGLSSYHVLRLMSLAQMERYPQLQHEMQAHASSSDAGLLWARAVSEIALKRHRQFETAVSAAMAANPLVPALLEYGIDEYSHVDPFNMPTSTPLGEAIQVALLIKDAWEQYLVGAIMPNSAMGRSMDEMGQERGEHAEVMALN